MVIIISNRLTNSIKGLFSNIFFNKINNNIKKQLDEKGINHYFIKFDLMEFNFKDIYQSFNISFLSNDSNKQFVDSNDLKYYESFEKSKDFEYVLIKRFKLRISLIKQAEFSENIVICEDYNFNPLILNNKDSIIKIAIIKNDIDIWLSNNYLDEYDCIFTINEYLNSLKNYKKVFIINGNSIYLMIKNILNEFHKRNNNDFFIFIKNKGFDRVFPKFNNYFKILDSELFNENWYKKEYDLIDDIDLATHYLLIGYKKGFNPSSNFNTFDYYEVNSDVEASGMNPLVHYELNGKKENRDIKLSDEKKEKKYLTILNSEYFDAEWYENEYDISDSNLDSAKHYLKIGYKKGFNPGPNFNTLDYYEVNSDVEASGMNPLLHYELNGKKEGRRLKAFNEDEYSIINDSDYFDAGWYVDNYDISDDVDPVNHYLKIGFKKGFNPGPNFNINEYYECNPDVKIAGVNPLIHYEQHGKHENRIIKLDEESSKRMYLAIKDSDYFDAKWYVGTYDISDDVDPVNHYLKIGFKKGFNPGPNFDNDEYLEVNSSLRGTGFNPLLFHELYGKLYDWSIK